MKEMNQGNSQIIIYPQQALIDEKGYTNDELPCENTREKEPEEALDHDFAPDAQLVPSGIF